MKQIIIEMNTELSIDLKSLGTIPLGTVIGMEFFHNLHKVGDKYFLSSHEDGYCFSKVDERKYGLNGISVSVAVAIERASKDYPKSKFFLFETAKEFASWILEN